MLRSVEFVGNDAIGARELARYLVSQRSSRWPWRAPTEFDRLAIEEDLRRIRALYQERGFFETRVEQRTSVDANGETTLIFTIVEGPAVMLSEIRIDAPVLEDVDLPRPPQLREGERFELGNYRAAKDELLGRLLDNGHPHAEVSGGADVDLSTHGVRVHWIVRPGPRIRLGEVHVSGNEEVSDQVIVREVDRLVAGRYSRAELSEAQRRVFALELFNTVQVEAEAPTDDVDADEWPIEVRVTERPPRTVEAGVGYGTEEQVRLRASWTHRDFLGSGRRFTADARWSGLASRLAVSLNQRHFLLRDLELEGMTALEHEELETYDVRRVGVSLMLRRPLNERISVRGGWALDWNDVSNVNAATEAVVEDAEDTFLLSRLIAGMRRRTTDSLLDPTRGTRFDLGVELSPVALGSEFDFLKATIEERAYHSTPLGVVAARLKLGVIQPFGGTSADEVPLVSRFFSGGSTSVRGYDFQTLGPLDADDEPLGGTTLAEASLELRFPIWRNLGGVAFTDAGQVGLKPFHWEPDEIFYSVGGGLRASTPVGPLRIDLGHALNPDPSADRFRLHLSIGQAF